MPKVIRPTYPPQFSVALLSLIFIISGIVSFQIFDVPVHDFDKDKSIYFGMFLIGLAVVIMLLIIWEEFLFPIKAKEIEGGLIFKNHRTKLTTQLLIYCTIPAIFIFIYLNYEVRLVRFIIFAVICIVAPVLEKIASGIKNYNDFLKLTDKQIEFRDNDKEGSFDIKDIVKIVVVKDDSSHIKEIELLLKNNDLVVIHIDKMELDAFYDSICKFLVTHYKHLLKENDLKA